MAPTRKGNPPHPRGPGRPVGTDSGRTREHLLRVSREVLVAEGFPRTTIREIAERANVNPALLHYYFGNKSGLHAAVVEEVGKQILSSLEAIRAVDDSPSERLRTLLRTYLRVLAEEPYVVQMLVHHLLLSDEVASRAFIERMGRPLVDAILEIVRDGFASQEFRPFDRSLVVSAIASSCLSFFLTGRLMQSEGGVDFRSRTMVESWADSIADLLLHGLAA